MKRCFERAWNLSVGKSKFDRWTFSFAGCHAVGVEGLSRTNLMPPIEDQTPVAEWVICLRKYCRVDRRFHL